jgi:hypothetical protein
VEYRDMTELATPDLTLKMRNDVNANLPKK